MATTQVRGVILIHSAPRALCPHLEWAVGRALGRAVSFDWADQPVLTGARRSEFYWEGTAGTGAALATAIRGWEHLRFEVTEDPTPRSDGGRWLHTPGLGIHYAQTDTAGNVVNDVQGANSTVFVDLAASYQITPQIQIRLEAQNITNEAIEYYYDSVRQDPYYTSFTGRKVSAGVAPSVRLNARVNASCESYPHSSERSTSRSSGPSARSRSTYGR